MNLCVFLRLCVPASLRSFPDLGGVVRANVESSTPAGWIIPEDTLLGGKDPRDPPGPFSIAGRPEPGFAPMTYQRRWWIVVATALGLLAGCSSQDREYTDGGSGGGTSTRSVVTVTATTKIRLKAHRNGSSQVWFGGPAVLVLPRVHRLTALQLE